MIRLLFFLDEISQELVTETSALYCVDGTLRIVSGNEIFLEEQGVPLVELALWLSHWLDAKKQVHIFYPGGYAENEGEMLRLVLSGGTRYALSYYNEETSGNMTAEQAEWEKAFTQFLMELRQALQKVYNLQLDNILLRLTLPKRRAN